MSRLTLQALSGGSTSLVGTDSSTDFLITVPAQNGTLLLADDSNDLTLHNLTLTGAVVAGAWHGSTIDVAYGGTGVTTLTGYVKGNGTSAMTASATIPSTDITGLGTMATQNASNVTITGGTISGLGTPLAVGSGGTGATSVSGLVFGNGTSAMSAATASQIVSEIGPTYVTNATNATNAVNATTATNIAGGVSGSMPYQTAAGTTALLPKGTDGQVLSLVSGLPAWVSVSGAGTVTSVDGSGGTTGLSLTGGPITSSGTLTLGGTLAVANGGTNITSYTTGDILYASASGVLSKLGIGTSGQVLSVSAGVPAWATLPASGTVTSVDGSGGTTGLTLTGGPITTSGTLTLGGTLAIANGGTGATTAGAALTALGAYPASNPSGYTSNTGTVTSVGGTGTVNGLTLTGTVTSSGSLTLGGTLDLSSPPAIGGGSPNTGTFTTLSDSYGNVRNIPQSGSAKTTSYTLATTDIGQYIQVGTGGSITIPNSTFATGNAVSIFNNTTGAITITCSTANAYIAGTDTNKTSVSLATRGVATILFISSTLCVISGNVS